MTRSAAISPLATWAAAWKPIVAITAFELALAAALRWSLPQNVSAPAVQIGIGYVVFMALGEVWGQWLHWRASAGRQPRADVRRFLASVRWRGVLGVVLLTAAFFSWFWPWTFRLWDRDLPRPLFGVADQLFTGPVSLAPIFLLHWWLEDRRTDGAPGSRGPRLRHTLLGLVVTLRVALVYWSIGLGAIFSLPLDFVFQNILVGAIQTPFNTFLFFMATRPHDHHEAWRMRPWATWGLPCIALHNLVVFPWYGGMVALAIGLTGYAAWLWLGFSRAPRGHPGEAKRPRLPLE